ncbi:hypothetical protein EJB05_55258, partial [Eragrostis curvula]
MNPHFPSDHDEGRVGGPFHRHNSIHKLLGGGKVADILLWKDRNWSAGVLVGATLIWYLFDVVEYNIVPLLCQIAILAMLVIGSLLVLSEIGSSYSFTSLLYLGEYNRIK